MALSMLQVFLMGQDENPFPNFKQMKKIIQYMASVSSINIHFSHINIFIFLQKENCDLCKIPQFSIQRW